MSEKLYDPFNSEQRERFGLSEDVTYTVPQKNLEGARFVFTVADLITATVKNSNPDWKTLGGVLRPEARTLAYRNGYIARCEITELHPNFQSVRRANVHPVKREHMITHYEVAVGGNARIVGLEKDRQGNLQPDGLLRHPIYPGQEIGRIAQQRDGIVEMPVANSREKAMVQKFLFPNWELIKEGRAPLPPTAQILRAHFAKLQDSLTPDHPHFTLFRKCAAAAILACDEFVAWTDTLIDAQNKEYDQNKVKGRPFNYGTDAQLAAAQCGFTLRDTAAKAQEGKIEQLVEASRQTSENFNRYLEWQMSQSAAGQSAPPKQADAETASGFDLSDEERALIESLRAKKTPPAIEDESIAEKSDSNEEENSAPEEESAQSNKPQYVLHAGRQAEIVERRGGNLKIRYIDGLGETIGVKAANCTPVE